MKFLCIFGVLVVFGVGKVKVGKIRGFRDFFRDYTGNLDKVKKIMYTIAEEKTKWGEPQNTLKAGGGKRDGRKSKNSSLYER